MKRHGRPSGKHSGSGFGSGILEVIVEGVEGNLGIENFWPVGRPGKETTLRKPMTETIIEGRPWKESWKGCGTESWKSDREILNFGRGIEKFWAKRTSLG